MERLFLFIEVICIILFCASCGKENDSSIFVETSETQRGQIISDQINEIEIESTIVKVENGNKGVIVRWNEIANIEGYYIYHKKEGEEWKVIAEIMDPKVVEYIDTEAVSGESYYYAVSAFAGAQKSDLNETNIITGVWEPKVKLIYYKTPKMKISWNEIAGCDGYTVSRKESGGKYSTIKKIKDSTITSYVDKDIEVGKIYTYAVRAYKGEEKSTYTAVSKASIRKPTINVNAINDGMEITWNEIEESEGYYVYRKEEGGKYTLLTKIEDKKTTSYLDKDYLVGTKYIYAVRSYLGKQKSSYGSLNVKADLGRVTVSLSSLNSGVKLEWNKISAAEGYYIYRKTGKDEDYSLIEEVDDMSITSYVDMQVVSGETYYYNVRAYFDDEQSEYLGSIITIK